MHIFCDAFSPRFFDLYQTVRSYSKALRACKIKKQYFLPKMRKCPLVGDFHRQDIYGEVAVLYFKPLVTQHMEASGLPYG